ncbi:carbohydrate-binding protein [Candidatus Leptofilum sp.]|uniref:carbohydrate-binding protein n=1 Tax=Candidatus Leptofilum sp. TaxID=3241576 RepID=UPI003B5C22E7
MNNYKHCNQNRAKEAGQGFTEYAIILILVGIAVVLVVSLMQPAIGDVFSRFVAQAPVAPPSLLNYTPPPSATNTPTVDPLASDTPVPSNTPIPSNTPVPSDTPVPSNTPIPSDTPVPSNTPSPTPCGPYGPFTVSTSSTVRIQAEDFRCGGDGAAFSDSSDGGPGSGAYRADVGGEGPDLENTSDAGGGYNVGWTRDGEWIEYEIESPVNDSFDFTIRHALPSGSSQISIRTTSVDFGFQDSTPTLNLPATGDWQTWQNFTTQITLYAGINIVRLNILDNSGNFNYFDFAPFVPTATPTPITPTATPVPTNTPVPTDTPVPVTITLYSNAGHDGDIRELDSSNTGDSGQVDNSGSNILVGDNNDGNNEQFIGIVSFDTSAIPANATIVSVELRLQQRNNLNGNPFGDTGLGTLYADIGPLNGFSGSYALEASDFEAPAAATNVITLSETSGNNQWSVGTLGSGNFSQINRNGFTQFKIHFEFPDDGDGSRDRFSFDSSDAGQPPAPELVITYTVP